MTDFKPIVTDISDLVLTPKLQPTSYRQVYIVDDDNMLRRALSFSLAAAGFVTRAFASGRDFLDEAASLAPGCVLLDVRMPVVDGLMVLAELANRLPFFAVVAMTGHGDVETAVLAMKRGARDFIEKPFTDAAITTILTTLLHALPLQVEAEVDREKAKGLIAQLTLRERDVLGGLVAGLSNKAVAFKLGVSVRTVEMHRGNLMNRLGAASLADAVRIAGTAGIAAIK